MAEKDNIITKEEIIDDMSEEEDELSAPHEMPDFDPDWLNPPDIDDYDVSGILRDLSEGDHSPTLYRDAVINQIMSVLISRDKPNALLVGPAGSGKTNIVEELACRIRDYRKGEGDPKSIIPVMLYDYSIYSLNLSDIVSGSGLVGDLERKVRSLINYLENLENRAILFLDEVHTLFIGETYKKVAQMLKPALSRGKFKVIAATTTQEVKKIDEDPAFNRRFTRVLVDELTKGQTKDIVESAVPVLEKHYGIKIVSDSEMSDLIVNVADEFCSVGSHRPDNALTLLDRTIAGNVVSGKKKKIRLTREMVEETAYRMTSGNSTLKILNETSLRKSLSRIRGQEGIVEGIIKVMKLYDMHIRPRTKPLTFLFAGPSGVGKSEIARILAKEYMDEKPIVLNMAEYNLAASINRIIGSPAGYEGHDSNTELPFDVLDTNPYQLILLDEFEKCDRSIQRLFMSAFDDGVMKTNIGKEIDFSKAIIIATTNAGCTSSSKNIGFTAVLHEGSDLTVSELSEFFDVELLNRFSYRYTFNSLDMETYREIVRDTYMREIERLDGTRFVADVRDNLKRKPDEKVISALVSQSYQSRLGARPAITVVTEYIDNMLLGIAKGGKLRVHNYAVEKCI